MITRAEGTFLGVIVGVRIVKNNALQRKYCGIAAVDFHVAILLTVVALI